MEDVRSKVIKNLWQYTGILNESLAGLDTTGLNTLQEEKKVLENMIVQVTRPTV